MSYLLYVGVISCRTYFLSYLLYIGLMAVGLMTGSLGYVFFVGSKGNKIYFIIFYKKTGHFNCLLKSNACNQAPNVVTSVVIKVDIPWSQREKLGAGETMLLEDVRTEVMIPMFLTLFKTDYTLKSVFK